FGLFGIVFAALGVLEELLSMQPTHSMVADTVVHCLMDVVFCISSIVLFLYYWEARGEEPAAGGALQSDDSAAPNMELLPPQDPNNPYSSPRANLDPPRG